MLYLIGGAPRAGKSMLAQRMLEQQKVAYFPTDLLTMGLTKAMPHLGLEHSFKIGCGPRNIQGGLVTIAVPMVPKIVTAKTMLKTIASL